MQTNTNQLKTFYIKSLRLAGYLMTRGFVLHSMKPDIESSRRNIFLFTNSRELINAIEDYKQMKGSALNGTKTN